MIRIIIGGILGAVIYFAWGFAAWTVIDLHGPTIHELPNEATTTNSFLNADEMETGVYYAPFMEKMEDAENKDSRFYKKYSAGPIYTVYYQKNGEAPMEIKRMINGFVIDLIAALLVAAMLSCAASGGCKKYMQRVAFVTGMGVFVALIGHAGYWNWMHFSLDYTIMFMVDVIIGWLLVGIIMAAIVRCPKAA